MVKKLLPYLNDAQDADTGEWICMSQHELQPFTGIEDADVENESEYSNRQNILVAHHTAYKMLCEKVLLNMEGNTDDVIAINNKTLKKAVADVVEVEFEVGKAKDGSKLLMTAAELKLDIAKKTCHLAFSLDIQLPLCDGIIDRTGVVKESFLFFLSDEDC